ncbi:MAG: hypothetical protein JWO04_5403 [Gammaproteobacteria bacterium]|nr:hypothetical protein [Gammaproteobacteria bacterium]
MVTKARAVYLLTAISWVAGQTGAAAAGAASVAAAGPAPECQAHAGFDRDLTLPGYLLPTKLGPTTCIPFTVTAQRPPAKYKGDFYVDEFTDQKLRQRWAECKLDKTCFEKVNKVVLARRPPNKEHDHRSGRDTYCSVRSTPTILTWI